MVYFSFSKRLKIIIQRKYIKIDNCAHKNVNMSLLPKCLSEIVGDLPNGNYIFIVLKEFRCLSTPLKAPHSALLLLLMISLKYFIVID